MANYNTQLQSNNTDLQAILNTINGLPEAGSGGVQATPIISVNTAGLITATAGAKSSTYQLAFQPGKTITPGTTSKIAVSGGYYTGGNITVAGDSNLLASNIKRGVNIFGVSGTFENEAYEWSENEDAIITRGILSYTNDRVDRIGKYAFASCYGLTTVSFPSVSYIASYAFADCLRLTTVHFPVATYIGSWAFSSCASLTTVSFPAVDAITSYAFDNCSRLTTVNFPVATDIGGGAFYDCTSLTTVSFPAATDIGTGAFYNCSRLTTVNFPAATDIGTDAFSSCTSLTTVSFPAATNISKRAFDNCRVLSSIFLTSKSMCRLFNSDAFTSTPYAGYSSYFSGTPYIYVPSSLLSYYVSATNWAYFSSYFSAYDFGEAVEPTKISFALHINSTGYDVDYEALEGMTWAQWLNSPDNNTTITVQQDSPTTNILHISGYGYIKTIDGTLVRPGDKIIANYTYYVAY